MNEEQQPPKRGRPKKLKTQEEIESLKQKKKEIKQKWYQENKDNIIEKYYLNNENHNIFKMSNIKYFSKYYILNDDLFINNVINGYEKYIKKDDVYIRV